MSEAVKTAKLPPFHETVQTALVQAVVGIQEDQRKQGEMLGLLWLVKETEIPEKALPGVIVVCAMVRDAVESLRSQVLGWERTDTTTYRSLGDLVKLAGDLVTNLKLRVEQKAREAATSGGGQK
ncbi:MAG: hypothetical protein HYT39_00455 [Candidatus Sungbacteria bacterium]|nr:hypothetical protein [Candidatus Sungbacteria bacterium]